MTSDLPPSVREASASSHGLPRPPASSAALCLVSPCPCSSLSWAARAARSARSARSARPAPALPKARRPCSIVCLCRSPCLLALLRLLHITEELARDLHVGYVRVFGEEPAGLAEVAEDEAPVELHHLRPRLGLALQVLLQPLELRVRLVSGPDVRVLRAVASAVLLVPTVLNSSYAAEHSRGLLPSRLLHLLNTHVPVHNAPVGLGADLAAAEPVAAHDLGLVMPAGPVEVLRGLEDLLAVPADLLGGVSEEQRQPCVPPVLLHLLQEVEDPHLEDRVPVRELEVRARQGLQLVLQSGDQGLVGLQNGLFALEQDAFEVLGQVAVLDQLVGEQSDFLEGGLEALVGAEERFDAPEQGAEEGVVVLVKVLEGGERGEGRGES